MFGSANTVLLPKLRTLALVAARQSAARQSVAHQSVEEEARPAPPPNDVLPTNKTSAAVAALASPDVNADLRVYQSKHKHKLCECVATGKTKDELCGPFCDPCSGSCNVCWRYFEQSDSDDVDHVIFYDGADAAW